MPYRSRGGRIVRAFGVGGQALVAYPPLLGGLTLGAGYLWSCIRRQPRADDAEAIAELRREQRTRLRRLLAGGATAVHRQDLPEGGPAYWDLDAGRAVTGRFVRNSTRAPAGRP